MTFNISKYLGMIHLCGLIIENMYGFLFVKNVFFDKFYIITFIGIPFSWIICRDECVVSYFIKKIENPNYILGSEPNNVKDISDLFVNERQYRMFYNVNNLLRIYSVILVNQRTTNIHHSIFMPTYILYLFYNYDISYNLNIVKKLFPYFQILFCTFLFTVFYKTIC